MVKQIAKAFAIVVLISLFGCTAKDPAKELRLYTWSEYFDQDSVEQFEKQTGAKVKIDYFSSNEQLLAKLQISVKGDAEGYDLILPSDYMVKTMRELNLIQKLNHSKLAFLKDLDPQVFKFNYDPGLTHAVPLTVGTTGVAVNTKLLKGIDPQKLTWKDMFENPALAGQVTFLDDAREVLQSILFIHGRNFANATEADVRTAFDYLKKHKTNIKAFTGETRSVVEADECTVCQMYSGDALNVKRTKPEIIFVNPKEGSTVWTDNFAIPVNARNPELAYAFINFMLSPEGSKNFTERLYYRTPNLKAQAMLSDEIRKNPGVFPPASVMKKTSFIPERKDLMLLIDKEWTKLKLM